MNKDKKTLWRDIHRSIRESKWRFLSIAGFMALGSFILVGLSVTGPDMRTTAGNYINRLHVADLAVVSDFGLDKTDQKIIDQIKGTTGIEYGYQQDVTVKDTDKSFRVFSLPEQISDVRLVEGKIPKSEDEIALDYDHAGDYKIGDTIAFTEKENVFGKKTLKQDRFKVTGYIYSGEIISRTNMGSSTEGSGELKGYATVKPNAFDSDVYMAARMKFKDTAKLDPYSKAYEDKIQTHKDELGKLLKDQPEIRMKSMTQEYQKQIDERRRQIAESKKKLRDVQHQLTDAKEKLENTKSQIAENEGELNGKVAAASGKILNGKNQVASAKSSIKTAQSQLKKGKKQLNSGKVSVSESGDQLELVRQQLQSAKADLDQANSELQVAPETIAQAKQQIEARYRKLAENQNQMLDLQGQNALLENELGKQQAEYSRREKEVEHLQSEYDTLVKDWEQALKQLNEAKVKHDTAKATFVQQDNKKTEYENRLNRLLSQIDSTEDPDKKKELKDQYDQLSQQYHTFVAGDYDAAVKARDQALAKVDELQPKADQAKERADSKNSELKQEKSSLQDASDALNRSNTHLQELRDQMNQINQQIQDAKAGLVQDEEQLSKKEAEYQEALKEYNQGIATYNQSKRNYYNSLSAWKTAVVSLNKNSAQYKKNVNRLRQAQAELESRGEDLAKAQNQMGSEKAGGEEQLMDARKELEDSEKEYQQRTQEFQEKKPDAEQVIREQEEKLDETQQILDGLKAPMYLVNGRKEMPGAEGYKVYDSISRIMDSLAMVIPIVLYLIAAVFIWSMITSFIEEEHENTGKQKAPACNEGNVTKRYLYYSLSASLTGAVLGIMLGHILLPRIVCDAYKAGFTLPKIKLQFHPGITLAALVLALISAALPVRIATVKKPRRHPMRHPKRMWMTIIGVTGTVSLLFAGFSVRSSIAGTNEKQFGVLGQMMKVLIIIATILGILIYYHLADISVSERIRETSSAPRIGSRKILLLTAVGIAAGFAIGEVLHQSILKVVLPDDAVFDSALSATPFVVPAVMIAVFTVLLGIYVKHKLKYAVKQADMPGTHQANE